MKNTNPSGPNYGPIRNPRGPRKRRRFGPKRHKELKSDRSPVQYSAYHYNKLVYDNPAIDPEQQYATHGMLGALLSDDQVQRVSNPSWRDQVLGGGDASTPYFRSDSIIQAPIWHGQGHLKFLHGTSYGLRKYTEFPNTNVRGDSTARDIALARVKSKIANATQGYNVLVPLAEIKELRDLVGQAVGITARTLDQLIKLKKGRLRVPTKRQLKEELRAAQEIWLGYSFGISPTMADIQGTSAAITAFLNNKHVDRVTGTGYADFWDSIRNDAITGGYGYSMTATVQSHTEIQYKFIAAWEFDIQSGNNYDAVRHFGITPPALISVAWELIPFSWVFDYFGTIGAYLEDTFVGQSGHAKYVIENRRCLTQSWTSLDAVFDPNGVDSSISVPGKGYIRFSEFQRSPLGALPARIIRFKTLDEIGKGGVKKLLNLAALLRF